ncbi:unnamed protein product [Acanthocheilonema viteae]|uniref:Uncharacterized protein n=1 Tax=Acanthocheilonema viteae TaxID=6277 RepID=A0A498S9U6_ACAVI|nr:unnamed protein product [Acanthocheilonema viteae]
MLVHEDGSSKKAVDRGLAIDVNSPFAKEIPEEAFDKKAEKRSYLMRRGAISIGIDSLELVNFVAYG